MAAGQKRLDRIHSALHTHLSWLHNYLLGHMDCSVGYKKAVVAVPALMQAYKDPRRLVVALPDECFRMRRWPQEQCMERLSGQVELLDKVSSGQMRAVVAGQQRGLRENAQLVLTRYRD